MTYGLKEYNIEIEAFEKAHGKDTMSVDKDGNKTTKKDFYKKLMDTHVKKEEFKIPQKCMVCGEHIDDCLCEDIDDYEPADMSKVEFVKIIITTTPVENFLEEVAHCFTFKKSYFEDCGNIEEVRDKFYEDLNDDYVVEYTEIYLYNTIDDVKEDNFVEYLGE